MNRNTDFYKYNGISTRTISISGNEEKKVCIKGSTATPVDGGGGGSNNVLTLSDIEKITAKYDILKSKHYVNYLYLLFEKRITYINELQTLGNVNWNKYINILKNLNIIQPVSAKKEYEHYLKTIRNYNHGNFNQIKFYEFTREGLEFFGQPVLKEFIYRNAEGHVLEYIEGEKQKFTICENERKLEEERIRRYNENRYSTYSRIPACRRTFEQQFFLDKYSKGDIKQ